MKKSRLVLFHHIWTELFWFECWDGCTFWCNFLMSMLFCSSTQQSSPHLSTFLYNSLGIPHHSPISPRPSPLPEWWWCLMMIMMLFDDDFDDVWWRLWWCWWWLWWSLMMFDDNYDVFWWWLWWCLYGMFQDIKRTTGAGADTTSRGSCAAARTPKAWAEGLKDNIWDRVSGGQHHGVTIQYHIIPCHTIPYYIIPYHTMPYHTILYYTIPYHAIPYHVTLNDYLKCALILLLCYHNISSIVYYAFSRSS